MEQEQEQELDQGATPSGSGLSPPVEPLTGLAGSATSIPSADAAPCECARLPEPVGFEGLDREPQSTFCVWNKYGHRPAYWHEDQEAAELEAARLARLNPGKTFIVFRKIVNIKARPEQSA